MSEANLKFIFANHDGVNVVMKLPSSTKISDVKEKLFAEWPESLDTPETATGFRLICMGQGILQDGKTIEECKVPTFAHPTPVNVAMLPKGFKPAVKEEKKSAGAKTSVSADGCCVVM